MKINDQLYQVDDVLGNPTLIVGDDELALVDAGLPNTESKVFALIESLGRQRGDLKHILLTHSDGDHIGSLHALVQATGAQVYASPLEAEVIEGKRKSRGGQTVSQPVKVDQVVKDGDVLPIHGGIRVIETHGHTVGHVSYLLERENLLIVGDCLVHDGGKLEGSRPQYTYDAAQAKQTVHKLAQLAPDALVFGHGTPLTSGAAEALKQLATQP